jgi:acetylglutamate kinase
VKMAKEKQGLTVVKVGGAVVEDAEQLSQLLKDFSAIEGRKVLVHGGGRRATKVAAALGIETKMVNGRRVTDADMLEVVTMVYGGLVNKNMVARLQAQGINAHFSESKGTAHEWLTWRRGLHEFIPHLFK